MTTTVAGLSAYKAASDATLDRIEAELPPMLTKLRSARDAFLRSAAIEASGVAPSLTVAAAAAALNAAYMPIQDLFASGDAIDIFDSGMAVSVASA